MDNMILNEKKIKLSLILHAVLYVSNDELNTRDFTVLEYGLREKKEEVKECKILNIDVRDFLSIEDIRKSLFLLFAKGITSSRSNHGEMFYKITEFGKYAFDKYLENDKAILEEIKAVLNININDMKSLFNKRRRGGKE